MSNDKFRGTGVALITPFKQDNYIDLNAIEKLVHFNIENGINYFVSLGTTGEAATLSPEEKRKVWQFTAQMADGKVPLVAGVGGNNTAEVMKEMKEFDIAGYSAFLSVSPYYNKPSQEGIYQHYMKLAEVSPLPIIIYNVPGRTGSNISAETILRLAKENEKFIGIKEASGNFAQIMHIVNERPKNFLVISGDDLITLPLISFGCDGVISVVAQAFPKEFSEMVKLALVNEVAARLNHFKLLNYMEWFFAESSPAGVKAALYVMNICQNILRLPLVPVSDALYHKIKKAIEDVRQPGPTTTT